MISGKNSDGVFFFTKKCPLYFKKCKNVPPSKRMVYFILNNLHFLMVEGIAFYAPYKSRVLIIPCKARFKSQVGHNKQNLKKNISSTALSRVISGKNSDGVFFFCYKKMCTLFKKIQKFFAL